MRLKAPQCIGRDVFGTRMCVLLTVVAVLLLDVQRVGAGDGAVEAVFPGEKWERRGAQEVGLDVEGLDRFAEAVGGDGVVVRHGYLVKSWGRPERRGDWASAAKPVLSTLLFFAVHEGKLESVDARVRPWVQRRWPGKDLVEKDRAMTFRHLADMTSGYGRAEEPGSRWAYNDYAINLYRHALTEVYATSLDEVATTRMEALHFEDGGVFGSRDGGGVNASPRDFARIGWFWLNEGAWAGEQLLPKKFFDAYCKADVPGALPRSGQEARDYLGIGTYGGGTDQSELGPGVYGFNWWFNEKLPDREQRFMPHLPRDAFQANGHWGRECMLIIPSLGVVAAARGNWGGTELPKAKLLVDAVRDR